MELTLLKIVDTLAIIIPSIALILLIFWDKRRSSLPFILLGILAFSVAIFIICQSYFYQPFSLLQTIISFSAMIVSVVFFYFYMKYSFWQGIFIVSVVRCYLENVHLLTDYIFFLFYGTLPSHPQNRVSIIQAALLILTFPLMYQLFKRLLRPALDYSLSMNSWKILWSIPLVNDLIYSLCINPDAPVYQLSDNTFYFLPPLWTFLTFTTIITQLQIITTLTENAKLHEDLRFSELQATAQQKQNDLIQKRIEETNRLHHDMKHNLLVLDSFIKDQDMDGLKNYLLEMNANLPSGISYHFCSNPAINSLLSYFRESAEQEFVDTTFSISVADTIPFADNDLCVVLGNLLENALEACRRMQSGEKYIRLIMSMTSRRMLVIICENSYSGEICCLPDGQFLSSKEKGRHGIGISSIINITEKYGGVHRFEYQDGSFKVSLLLNAKTQP